MPDLERRSSASFISSKDGGTPDSCRRSWMKRSNSFCFLVSISCALRRRANHFFPLALRANVAAPLKQIVNGLIRSCCVLGKHNPQGLVCLVLRDSFLWP